MCHSEISPLPRRNACGFLSNKSARDFNDLDIAEISLIVLENPNLNSEEGSSIWCKPSANKLTLPNANLASSVAPTKKKTMRGKPTHRC